METAERKFTFRKMIKYIAISISLAVYIIFSVRLFTACDADIADDVYLSPERAEEFKNLDNDIAVYHYQPIEWTSEDGTIQIKNIYWIDKFSNLQLTVRTRDDTYESPDGKYPFKFLISVKSMDEESRKYEIEVEPEVWTDTRYGYTYARLSADNIVCVDAKKDTYEVETFDPDTGLSSITTQTALKGGTVVNLTIKYLDEDLIVFSDIAGRNVESRTRLRRGGMNVVVIE